MHGQDLQAPVRIPDLGEITEAARRIAPHLDESPVFELPLGLPGKRIFIKDEGRNRAGAFKLRGALNAVLSCPHERIAEGVCTVSSGNMAYAVAVAARIAGVPMAAYMYAHAPHSKMEGVRENGGEVRIVSDEVYWSYALGQSAPETEWAYIYPVTDQAVITGHASIGLEIAQQVPDADVVLTPYGAGGLTTGTASALHRLGHTAEVVAVEAEVATPVAAALAAGHPVTVEMQRSFVKAIGAPTVIDGVWSATRQLVRRSSVVTLEQTVAAMRLLYDEAKIVTEGASATALAAAIHDPALTGTIVCVLSGHNIDAADYATVLQGGIPQ
ncbi:threonine ammonia-lyase [Nioella nitratireducens]|uniref:threonine ammonia-lyase n=1 Tax=Nioella nitratireducens TaxID=1287720 RepID=UPI0008FD8965|nr:pyridoxal-phosphate dependent enzyme [Nioella nitratireducens]